MKNQVYTGTPTSRRFALCPTTIKAGAPVLLGNPSDGTVTPAFALDDYQAITGGTTFLLNGTFATSVVGSTTNSPVTGHVINPGDQLFAEGTFDTATNLTYNLLINADSSNIAFGHLDPSYVAVGSGLTDTAAEVLI